MTAMGKGIGSNTCAETFQNHIFHFPKRMVKGKTFYYGKEQKQNAQIEKDPVLIQNK
jgi:hypothetical protein